jgi:ATP-dependent DNA helicase PIF1
VPESKRPCDKATKQQTTMRIIMNNNDWNESIKQQVLGLLQEGQSVFLTGGAGSGKSYLLNELVNAMPNSIVLAPTGVAAQLLNNKYGIKAQTIHSFFKFPLHRENAVSVNLPTLTKRSICGANAIFIDEASMVDSERLDGIEYILRNVRGNDRPFGGVAVCLVGDLAQLPPVVPTKSSSGISEAEVLRKMGYDTTSIEGARVWSAFQDNTFELHGSRRIIDSSMEEDRLFYLLLTNMRQYLLGERKDIRNELNWLNKLCVEKELDSDFITLATTNDTVRQINDNKLAELSGKPFIYKGVIEGEWRNDIARAPLELTLKVGTKVICVMNDPMGQFVNGSIGRVLALDTNSITVAIKNRGQEREVEINPVQWDNWQYQWDDGQGLVVKSVGTFSQFPVTLGYALTVNSAQGLTIERGVHFIPEKIFTRELPYVAISRVTSIAGLSLSKPLTLH